MRVARTTTWMLFSMLVLALSLSTVGCSKTSEDEPNETGDGDSGDGDGDGDSGDGDGDGDTGDGDGDGDTTGDGDGDGDATGDGDGDGDATGDGDGDGDVSEDDAGALTGEVCGSTRCMEGGCCADPFQALCGAPIGARGCIMPPPEDANSDDRCPGINAGGFFTIPSCCTADGDCGIDASQFGADCIELSMFKTIIEQQAGGMVMIEVPEPQRCE